jgi:hypothetical protein
MRCNKPLVLVSLLSCFGFVQSQPFTVHLQDFELGYTPAEWSVGRSHEWVDTYQGGWLNDFDLKQVDVKWKKTAKLNANVAKIKLHHGWKKKNILAFADELEIEGCHFSIDRTKGVCVSIRVLNDVIRLPLELLLNSLTLMHLERFLPGSVSAKLALQEKLKLVSLHKKDLKISRALERPILYVVSRNRLSAIRFDRSFLQQLALARLSLEPSSYSAEKIEHSLKVGDAY